MKHNAVRTTAAKAIRPDDQSPATNNKSASRRYALDRVQHPACSQGVLSASQRECEHNSRHASGRSKATRRLCQT
jgi:hypothetical protein